MRLLCFLASLYFSLYRNLAFSFSRARSSGVCLKRHNFLSNLAASLSSCRHSGCSSRNRRIHILSAGAGAKFNPQRSLSLTPAPARYTNLTQSRHIGALHRPPVRTPPRPRYKDTLWNNLIGDVKKLENHVGWVVGVYTGNAYTTSPNNHISSDVVLTNTFAGLKCYYLSFDSRSTTLLPSLVLPV